MTSEESVMTYKGLYSSSIHLSFAISLCNLTCMTLRH